MLHACLVYIYDNTARKSIRSRETVIPWEIEKLRTKLAKRGARKKQKANLKGVRVVGVYGNSDETGILVVVYMSVEGHLLAIAVLPCRTWRLI